VDIMNKIEAIEVAKLLKNLIEIQEISIILNTFLTAFEKISIDHKDGRRYLHGNFNIGGTVSGRMSSSKPNLQNIPSTGTKYAKHIKECFSAPDGWLILGADFSSLEDKISALTTKDPNKLKIYEEGLDGHSYRAFNYYKQYMPDIDNTVESINSIQDKYPDYRQDSKGSTFALTYGGTSYALVNQCGLSQSEAYRIENEYHKLYKHSDEWVAKKIKQAAIDGYITVAFGLRVRTPVLAQTILNTANTPFAAQGEARTAGNALGQSYGLLNNRAGIEMYNRILEAEYDIDIFPIAHIHDAQYFLVRNEIGIVHWFNENLVPCMEWQNLPEIKHDQVKLGGEVDVHYKHWGQPITLKNGANMQEILTVCQKGKEKFDSL